MRWLVGLVVLLTGCDKVFSIDVVPQPSVDAATFSCASPLLVDNFTDPTPCAPWGTFFPSGTIVATTGNGSLTFTIAGNSAARCETTVQIAPPFGGLAVRVSQTPAGNDSYMSLESKVLDLEITTQNGRLKFTNGGGVTVHAEVQYNAVAMQYWRIEPHADMTATASYSPDAITWTPFDATVQLATLPAMADVELKAGVQVNIQSTTDATFQSLIACP